MRHDTPGLTLAGIAALLLVACGGGGGSSSSSSSSSSGGRATARAASRIAGANQTVLREQRSRSMAPPAVTPTARSPSTPGRKPRVAASRSTIPVRRSPLYSARGGAATTLSFSLVVTDNRGAASTAATVTITVNPATNVPPTANAGANQTVTRGNSQSRSTARPAATPTAQSPATHGRRPREPPSRSAALPHRSPRSRRRRWRLPPRSRSRWSSPTIAAATSAASTVNVTVNPQVVGNVNVTGNVTLRAFRSQPRSRMRIAVSTTRARSSSRRAASSCARSMRTRRRVLATGSTDASATTRCPWPAMPTSPFRSSRACCVIPPAFTALGCARAERHRWKYSVHAH